ncbi:MAG TPA: serine/threonine-protein kinase [Kofleriaceae bacterium]|nr:serine/threonine-protein kinase [Kofleriaceae bacterium]
MANESDLPTLPSTATSGDEAEDAHYGRFISLGVIGQGGMGVVLRAHDPELDRNVAIKVLAPALFGARDPSSDQRLQREAQAMAKLSHPNVVHVYEMGRAGSSSFIAMELVEGSTLRRWLTDRSRPWRDVVAAFIACGRGLEAAHDAGLVHRDFKPENVLIGADQRPRVTDFGLVATGVTFDSADLGDGSPISGLTVRGAVIGTPMYMSPEQWMSKDVDARTDQFAFCVALWEGVYGERPFSGRTSNEVRDNVLAGKLRDVPDGKDAKRVPRWLEATLRRGLAVNRDDRWPSMTALLAQLDRPAPRRWPWAVAAAGVLGAGAVTAALVLGSPAAPDPCPDPRARLAGVWDAGVAERVTRAFTAASPGLAAEMAARIRPQLDAYATRWRDVTLAACKATKVEGTQSPQLLDQRMVCLDRRLAELQSLTAALATADRARVSSAIEAVAALGDLDVCSDKERMLAFPPPTDAALRRRIDAVESEIAAARASEYTSKPSERHERAKHAVEAARATGYLPVLVHALEEAEMAAIGNDDVAAAIEVARELAQKAAEARDDELSAFAWTNLIRMLARTHKREEAAALDPVAASAVARSGSPPGLRYGLYTAQGVRHMYAQELDESVKAYSAALDVADSDVKRASAKMSLAQAIYMRDGATKALPVLEEGLALTEQAYGKAHPYTADGLVLRSQMLLEVKDLAKSQEAAERALAIRRVVLDPMHRDIGIVLHQLANGDKLSGNLARAKERYRDAIAVFESGRDAKDAALSYAMLAGVVADTDGLAAARPLYAKGLDGLAATFGKEHMQYLTMAGSFAQRLIENDLCREAMPIMDHVMEAMTRVMPREVPQVYEQSGLCEATLGNFDAAVTKLERARALCKEHACDYAEDLDWDLGKVLVTSGRDRARGMKLIGDAEKLAAEHEYQELLDAIAAWRKQQR